MTFGYPVFLDLAGVPVLVVGGGQVALRKATGLVEAGAAVTAIAPEFVDEFDHLPVTCLLRPYAPGDVEGFQLVMTATNVTAINAAVAADASAARIWVNSADDQDNCSFILPAIARRGQITVAVSTGGASPALARRIRDEIAADHLTPAVEAAAVELARQRAGIHATGASTENIDWAPRVDAALGLAQRSMPTPADRILAVLDEVIARILAPECDLSYSSFADAETGAYELGLYRDRFAAGDTAGGVGILFAATGPVQQAAISSGWGDRFCELADQLDAALAALAALAEQ